MASDVEAFVNQVLAKLAKDLEYLDTAVGAVLGFIGVKLIGEYFGFEIRCVTLTVNPQSSELVSLTPNPNPKPQPWTLSLDPHLTVTPTPDPKHGP